MNNEKKPALRFKGFTDDWEQRKVTDIGKIYIGLVTTMTKYYTDEGTLLIRNSDIKDGRFEFGDNPIYLENSFAQKNESRMHQLGDVVTVHTGDVGTSAVISENEVKSIGFATIVTRPNKKTIDSNYLCSFLNTEKHKKWAVGVSTGDGRTNYNLGDYFELVVPVPSIKEQQKIASFIQKINYLITLHQRQCLLLQRIRFAMVASLFVNKKNNDHRKERALMIFQKEADFEEALIKVLGEKGWEKEVIKYPTEKDLIDNWARILYENNNSIDRLNGYPLTDGEMQQILEQINTLRTPLKLNQFINGKTVSVKRDHPEDVAHFGKEVSLKIYDRHEIAAGQSKYQIVQQPVFARKSKVLNDRRGDLMLLINGMPVIHIELKRSGVPVSQA